MAEQYWIGGFFIDLSRNQITQNEYSQTIPPKALAVLTYLAKNQGKVVSHDDLLANVWQGTVVSPNSLQRCITQLRKALGDDGKIQDYIKTHAKQGYSLECDVRWHDNVDSPAANTSLVNTVYEPRFSDATSDSDPAIKAERSRPSLILPSIVAGILVLGVIGYKFLIPTQASQLNFDTLRLLTATDDKEYDATYTPDGKYIVFHRYLDKQCGNKLWAKNIATQKEVQLTKDWGAYGSHSFSKDGKKLVFFETEACSEPATQKNCYDLVSLDFEKALKDPQDSSLILQCQNSNVRKPIWLNNGDVALLQQKTNRWKLISYSISKNRSTDLFEVKDGNLVDFAYSVRDDLIAVTSIHNDGEHYIEMLKPDGQLISSHRIKRPQAIPKFRSIRPSFDPINKQLIFSTGRQLFTLSYEGKISKISFPLAESAVQPEFHPGGRKLLLTKGPYDSDIVLLPLDQLAGANSLTQTEQAEAEQSQSYVSFERSNLGESYAIFQPRGELIAFRSERSGEQQIWVSDGNGEFDGVTNSGTDGKSPQQLTQFPIDTHIGGFDWAADGKSLLVNANNILTQVFLDSSHISFPLKHPVLILYQWDSKNNTALSLVRINGILRLVEIKLTNSEIRVLADKNILWALKSEDGRLIYKDYQDQFWQPGPAESQRIAPLAEQGGRAKSFVMKGNVMYGINAKNQLWAYDLHAESFTVLREVSEDVDYLSDFNQRRLLMTVRVAAKKELVELSVSK